MNRRIDTPPASTDPCQITLTPALQSGSALDRNEWSIEALRGIAALMVILAHYWSLAGIAPGRLVFVFTGVDLFFVISGFVFAPYLLGRDLALIPHLIRRFFRIYPLYAVAVFVYAGLRLQQGMEADHVLAHLLFLHTVESREVAFYFNPAFWSLPPEVEFYLALPLLALIGKGLPRLLALLAAALAMHLVLAYTSPAAAAGLNLSYILNVHLPGLLVEFVLGALAWWWVASAPVALTRLAVLLGGIVCWVLVAALYSGYFLSGSDDAVMANPVLRGNVGLLAAAAYAMMVAALVGWVAQPPAWARSVATTLGNLSYGLYLFHNAAPVMLRSLKSGLSSISFAALCLALTVVLAAALHIAWERPLRAFGRNLARRR